MIGRVRLSAELDIALLVAIEDVRGSAESRENLAQLVVLVRLVEACGDLVHGGHWATRRHVDPQSGKETKDAAFEVLRVHHDIHFVLGVARVHGIGEAAIIVVPFHHEGATSVVLGVLVGRPRLGRPAVGMEVALGRTIEGRVLGVLTTVVILDVFKTLSEVLVMVGLTPVCLKDDVREESSELTLANFSRSKTKRWVVLSTEFWEETSSHCESLVCVKSIV